MSIRSIEAVKNLKIKDLGADNDKTYKLWRFPKPEEGIIWRTSFLIPEKAKLSHCNGFAVLRSPNYQVYIPSSVFTENGRWGQMFSWEPEEKPTLAEVGKKIIRNH